MNTEDTEVSSVFMVLYMFTSSIETESNEEKKCKKSTRDLRNELPIPLCHPPTVPPVSQMPLTLMTPSRQQVNGPQQLQSSGAWLYTEECVHSSPPVSQMPLPMMTPSRQQVNGPQQLQSSGAWPYTEECVHVSPSRERIWQRGSVRLRYICIFLSSINTGVLTVLM